MRFIKTTTLKPGSVSPERPVSARRSSSFYDSFLRNHLRERIVRNEELDCYSVFNDESTSLEFKEFSRSHCDIVSMTLFIVASVGLDFTCCNLCLGFDSGPYFVIVLSLWILANAAFFLFLLSRFRSYLFADKSWILARVSLFSQSFLGNHIEDILSALTSVLCGLILVAVTEGEGCGESRKVVWILQGCNTGYECGLLPSTYVICCYLTPILVQMCARGVTMRCAVVSWIISTIFVITAIVQLNTGKDYWLGIFSLFFLAVSYEHDKGMRHSFVRLKRAHDAHDRQRCLPKLQHNYQARKSLFGRKFAKGECQVPGFVVQNQRHSVTMSERHRAVAEGNKDDLRSLLGNVAHDLKTPLQSIGMGADDIQRRLSALMSIKNNGQSAADFTLLAAEERNAILESAYLISTTIAFMSMTINRAIDFTKASHNMVLVHETQTLDLESTLKWPISVILSLQSRTNVILEPLSPSFNHTIMGDKGWLTENTLCLLSNAVKYSDGGDVHVRCFLMGSLHNESTCPALGTIGMVGDVSECKLCIEIEDRGIGIPPDAMDKLFSPFSQCQRLATGGSGLGLFCLRKRIQTLGGECGVRGRKDGLSGSCFWFTFPYVAGESSPSEFVDTPPDESELLEELDLFPRERSGVDVRSKVRFNSATSIPRLLDVSLKKANLSVLFVDDSLMIQKLCSRSLEGMGCRVTLAENGLVALNILKESPGSFDVMLTDLQMPVMGGVECVRLFREYENEERAEGIAYYRLPIVGMSANSEECTKRLSRENGMDGFIAKPFKIEKFLTLVSSLFPVYSLARKISIIEAKGLGVMNKNTNISRAPSRNNSKENSIKMSSDAGRHQSRDEKAESRPVSAKQSPRESKSAEILYAKSRKLLDAPEDSAVVDMDELALTLATVLPLLPAEVLPTILPRLPPSVLALVMPRLSSRLLSALLPTTCVAVISELLTNTAMSIMTLLPPEMASALSPPSYDLDVSEASTISSTQYFPSFNQSASPQTDSDLTHPTNGYRNHVNEHLERGEGEGKEREGETSFGKEVPFNVYNLSGGNEEAATSHAYNAPTTRSTLNDYGVAGVSKSIHTPDTCNVSDTFSTSNKSKSRYSPRQGHSTSRPSPNIKPDPNDFARDLDRDFDGDVVQVRKTEAP